MGNKADKLTQDINQSQQAIKPQTPLHSPPISRSSFEVFLKCVHNLPFTLSEEQFESIIYDLKERTYPPQSIIIKEGSSPVGLFVIIQGICKVVSSNGTVLQSLESGNLFGEISCFYNKPCTCSIICDSEEECKVIFLDLIFAKELVNKRQVVSMRKYFIQQQYLDTSNLFPVGTITKEIIKECMLVTPLFEDWSEKALSLVIDNLTPSSIEIYPPGSCIYSKGDHDAYAFILLKGAVELYGDKPVASFSAHTNAVWFGDEQLFSYSERVLSANALTISHIITFVPDYFSNIINEFPIESAKLMNISDRWKVHQQHCSTQLPEKFQFLDVTALNFYLKEIEIFQGVNLGFLYFIALGMTFGIATKDESLTIYFDQSKLILMIKGTGEIITDEEQHFEMQTNDFFILNSKYEKCNLVSLDDDVVVGYITKSLIENIKNIYPETLLDIEL